ncbi:MAG: Hsp20/alpha crystallin family protein [Pseudomonadota bacterium]
MASTDKSLGLFDDFYQPFGSFFAAPARRDTQSWLPAVDITKQDGNYLIEMEVPGFKPDEIEVEAHDQVLTIQGSRSSESEKTQDNYVHRERRVGRFVRRFNLPAGVDGSAISAQVKDGVLHLTVPSAQAESPQKIAVK